MFVKGTIFQLIFLLLSIVVIVVMMRIASKGKKMPELRNFPAINAIKEAIGRAVETNRPVVYNLGISGLRTEAAPMTLAGLDILSHVAMETASSGAKLIIPVCQGENLPIVNDIVFQSYISHGDVGSFNTNVNIIYMGGSQWPYVAGVMGLLRRERPAANILMGHFWGESLLQTEAGFLSGAIQIGGTAEFSALPYFAATCDYFLIGEELYAAAAFISRDDVQIATIIAEDVIKLSMLIILVIGILLYFGGNSLLIDLLRI